METNIRNKCKAYTSLEQSKKLAEMLPLESADMHLTNSSIKGEMYTDEFKPVLGSYLRAKDSLDAYSKIVNNMIAWEVIPCWSLAALISVLPKGTNISTPKPVNALGYCCWNQYDEIYADNPVDVCVEMIIKLHELKML